MSKAKKIYQVKTPYLWEVVEPIFDRKIKFYHIIRPVPHTTAEGNEFCILETYYRRNHRVTYYSYKAACKQCEKLNQNKGE